MSATWSWSRPSAGPAYWPKWAPLWTSFPGAEWIGERTLSLPLSPALKKKDVEDVISAFRKVIME